MVIDKNTVEYVADLSKLKVNDAEMDDLCRELNTMLEYVDEICSTINTDSITLQVGSLSNVMRTDEALESMDRDLLLANAPEHTETTPVVPIIVR